MSHLQTAFLITLFSFITSLPFLLQASDAHAFCSRALASRSCPSPPSATPFDIDLYLGRWYGVGSTARFKTSIEAGVICDQAVYSSSAGKLRLLNSGLEILSRAGMTQIRRVSSAARSVCKGARHACFQAQSASKARNVLQSLNNTDYSELANQLNAYAEALGAHLQKIAELITSIQKVNGQISQANVSSLQASVNDIISYVGEARREQGRVAEEVGGIDKITAQLRELSQKAGMAIEAKQDIDEACTELAALAAGVTTSSSSMKAALKTLQAQAGTLLSTARPINDPQVGFVTGRIRQPFATSPSKLEVAITGTRAPYWILDVERDSKGAYAAALVYSCREVAGESASSLFILTREPHVDAATLQGFLQKAESRGIYDDCENPFLLSVERGGTCGQAPSSS